MKLSGTSLFIACVIYLLHSVDAAYRRTCHDISSECLTKSLQLAIPSFVEGIPELGLETLDPYYIERLDLTLPGGITIEFSKGHAKGLRNCIVDFVRLKGDTLETQMHCNLTIKGRYRSKGKLLMFPIDGEGNSTIKCSNLRLTSKFKLKSRTETDGHQYLEIKGWNVTHSYDGRVHYGMTNLFRNNPEISNAVLNFMNNNWRMVAEEFGKPVVDFGVSSVMKNVKRLLKVLPLDQIVAVKLDL